MRRPDPGIPWDKRLTAAKLSEINAQAQRPFDPATDIDLLDEIEAEIQTQLAPALVDPDLLLLYTISKL